MARTPAALSCLSVLLLAGCIPGTNPTVTVTVPPSTITPSPTSTVPPGTPGGVSTPLPTPSAPTTTGALAVTGLASFATPTGRIWCATDGNAAWCHFPKGMTAKVPSSNDVCPGEGLDVTGVTVGSSAPDYFCSGDPTAFPVKGQDSVAWHDATKFPWVTYDGFTLAVLPYGKKISEGDFVCASETVGVTCANVATGAGFRISLSGPVFF